MKQTVGNACGTIGLLHAIANIRHLDKPGGMLSLNLLGPQDSYLRTFFHATEALTPEGK